MEGRLFASDTDPQFALVLRRLRAGKGDALRVERKRHACAHSVCNPQCELQLVAAQRIPGPVVSSNVYLCDYGRVHVCTVDVCELYGVSPTQTCPVSGVQHGTMVSGYAKGDWRTWHPNDTLFATTATLPSGGKRPRNGDDDDDDNGLVAVKQEPKHAPAARAHVHARKLPSDEGALGVAREVVTALLYSSSRTARNDMARAQRIDRANHEVQRYVAKRLRVKQLPFGTDVYRLRAHHKELPLPLREFETNWARIDYYASILVQVWRRVLLHYAPRAEKHFDEVSGAELLPRSIDMVCVFLGALYVMREGHHAHDQEVLPCDRFLAAHLPQISDLEWFGYSRSDPSTGTTLVHDAYKNALIDGIAPRDLVLDVRRLPERGKQLGVVARAM